MPLKNGCLDEGVDPRTIDMTGFVNEKLDELENKK